ncbi:MAG: glycosyltransferase family 4 protein [Candidatus Marinimicrobia bacterium]|jgi:glycosyltransferase involved in cell wall biosynthesis|nr:glycosyltransferase family 4 protein [Candidatus Neomarinimicrobiota bacterium]MCK9559219.1 glycosyltransferase family 4 protein [Candidatus Neomarinimicrobiota bacterium]MDD5231595.1 glycosyltransferase family 4 protein [Candidatus Neomarinimicrobiota bacterium]
MKVVLFSNTSWYLFNFRLPLIKVLMKHGYQVVTIAPQDDYTSMITSEGIIHYNASIDRRGLTIIPNLKTIISVYRLYHSLNPDIVIHFTIKPVIFGTLIARLCTRAKIINNVTGLGYVFIGTTFLHTFLRPFVQWMYKCILRLSSLLIFQNKADRDFFIKSKIITQKIPSSVLISGSGVDLGKFHRNGDKEVDPEVHFILIARMLYDKGIQEFIDAAEVVQKTYSNVVFHLVGDIDRGNPTAITMETISRWIERGIVNYHGRVDNIVPLLANADVFVLPSYREGLSRSIIEGMAMELPIITTNVPGCRETVIEYENGLLIRPYNVPDLIEAITFMIKNPEQRLKMGKKSRQIAESKFDVEIINKKYIYYLSKF